MVGGLYERIAKEPGGLRSLASARLRRRVLTLLHKALERSGLTQSDLAKKLGYRRSAVNQVFRGDGNVRIETLAEYLHEMGFELDVNLVAAGEHRRSFEQKRTTWPHTEAVTASLVEVRIFGSLHQSATPQTSNTTGTLRLGAMS